MQIFTFIYATVFFRYVNLLSVVNVTKSQNKWATVGVYDGRTQLCFV
jgi:hypothetical protein